jgi:hypothetical protein
MNAISELEEQIREFINNPRKEYVLLQNTTSWNMLCSCLDLIGDTELAIAAYHQTLDPADEGGSYLLVYGILQTLFLQQDAVRNLCEALKIDYAPDPSLEEIREIRNDSAGHPSKRGGGAGKAFNFISRMTLNKYGFELMTTFPDKRSPLFRHVNIPSLIESQQNTLADAMKQVIERLKAEEVEYKAMFKSDRLQDAFPPVLHYYFEKIFEAIHGDKPAEFGAMHVKLISETIEALKEKLKKRGVLGAYDSITYLLDLLAYPISELSNYFSSPGSSGLNSKSGYIFTFFIQKHLDELKEIAKEIDEDYELPKEGTT